MQPNISLPTPEKMSIKRVLKAPAIVLVLLLAAFFGGIRWINVHTLSNNPIFHQTKTGWEQLPPLLAFPETLKVTSNGTLLVRTSGKYIMSRWDGKVWTYYDGKDLSAKINFSYGEIALDGELVWAPTNDGMLHWDGHRWQLMKDVSAAEDAAIVAGGGQVWVVDYTGKFSHYKDGQWRSQPLDLPGMKIADKQDVVPQLARTTNGVVWLMWQGLWKFDRAKWTSVTDGENRFQDGYLVGAASDHLWFSDKSGLHSLSMDAKHWAVYTRQQAGLPKDALPEQYIVRGVASLGGRTWFAATTAFLEFDGSEWNQIPLPSQQISGIQKVVVSPDGELWIMGFASPVSPGQFRSLFLLIGLLPVAILGVVIWTFQRFRRRRLHQHQLVAQAVQHATGEIPDELQAGERRHKWYGSIVTLITIFGTGVAFYVVRKFWPQAPGWLILVFAVLIHGAATFQQSLVKRKAKPSDPIGPGAPSTHNWGRAWKAVAGTVAIIAIANTDRLLGFRISNAYYFLLLVVVPVAYHWLMLYLTNAAVRRADYDGGLKIIRWFNFYNPSGNECLRLCGHILVLAGRYREAEDTLRRSLGSSHARQTYAEALESLGDALMEQGRYDEATRSYEAALHAFSWRLRPYRGMAELLLRRGNNPRQALEYVEKIIDFTGLSAIHRKGNGRAQDDYWSLKAWALAAGGRTSEVQAAIDSALKATEPKSAADLATTHYRAGMAMQARGHNSSAKQHFQRAIDLDPNGRRGLLSRAAMHQQKVQDAVPV